SIRASPEPDRVGILRGGLRGAVGVAGGEGHVRPDPKLDQLMVLLPMLRFLRIFLLLRRSCICEHGEDRVDCEHRDRGRLCERVLQVARGARRARGPPSAPTSGGPSSPPPQWATATTSRSPTPA